MKTYLNTLFRNPFSLKERLVYLDKPHTQSTEHDQISEAQKAGLEAAEKEALGISAFEFEIKNDGKYVGDHILAGLQGQGKSEKHARRLMHLILARMSDHEGAPGEKGFDVNYVFPGDKFEISADEAVVTRKGKEVAKINLGEPGKTVIAEDARKNWGDLKNEVVKANAVEHGELEKAVKKENLSDTRMLLGLKTVFKARKEDWVKDGGGTDIDFKSPVNWIKETYDAAEAKKLLNEDGEAKSGTKGYIGTAAQNIAYCKYYLAMLGGDVEVEKEPVVDEAAELAKALKEAQDVCDIKVRALKSAQEQFKAAANAKGWTPEEFFDLVETLVDTAVVADGFDVLMKEPLETTDGDGLDSVEKVELMQSAIEGYLAQVKALNKAGETVAEKVTVDPDLDAALDEIAASEFTHTWKKYPDFMLELDGRRILAHREGVNKYTYKLQNIPSGQETTAGVEITTTGVTLEEMTVALKALTFGPIAVESKVTDLKFNSKGYEVSEPVKKEGEVPDISPPEEYEENSYEVKVTGLEGTGVSGTVYKDIELTILTVINTAVPGNEQFSNSECGDLDCPFLKRDFSEIVDYFVKQKVLELGN